MVFGSLESYFVFADTNSDMIRSVVSGKVLVEEVALMGYENKTNQSKTSLILTMLYIIYAFHSMCIYHQHFAFFPFHFHHLPPVAGGRFTLRCGGMPSSMQHYLQMYSDFY